MTRLAPLLPQVAALFGIEVPEKAPVPKPLRPTPRKKESPKAGEVVSRHGKVASHPGPKKETQAADTAVVAELVETTEAVVEVADAPAPEVAEVAEAPEGAVEVTDAPAPRRPRRWSLRRLWSRRSTCSAPEEAETIGGSGGCGRGGRRAGARGDREDLEAPQAVVEAVDVPAPEETETIEAPQAVVEAVDVPAPEETETIEAPQAVVEAVDAGRRRPRRPRRSRLRRRWSTQPAPEETETIEAPQAVVDAVDAPAPEETETIEAPETVPEAVDAPAPGDAMSDTRIVRGSLIASWVGAGQVSASR